MSSSAGRIDLDLNINRSNFDRQLNSIQGLAKKAGSIIASAFAIKGIFDFSKQCINLGSDLSEVQNVVDVTFKTMSKQIDKFAQSAAVSFGLSETMAKKFTGTFGAMAKAFGFSEKAAYEMSTTLTGLAGDVASFYNISQDEAYYKLKSVFTGETESLKDLGIVMTQSALDSYALANGFGKTTQKMSEAEKVALRYQFVQEQLTLASGDFLRTSDGWANQVRVLQLQFDSLKATIGQGLINVLSPVLKMINNLISKLISLANAFKAFTELITGKKSSGTTTETGIIAEEAKQAETALDGVTGAAKKAKKATTSETNIDELNVISQGSNNSSDGGNAESGVPELGTEYDFGNLAEGETELDRLDTKFQALIQKVKELAEQFKLGFFDGFKDTKALENIDKSIENIKENLTHLFTDRKILNSAENLGNSIIYNLGKITGSSTSIGLTIADTLIGGFDKFLEQNSDYIKNRIVNIFNAESEIATQWGNTFSCLAEIFKVFSNEDGKQIVADIIGIFSGIGFGIIEILSRELANISYVITQPFIDNKDKLKTALENTLTPISNITTSIREFITNTFEKISETYDTYIEPAIEKFKNGWSNIFSGALDAYNTYLAPVLDWISERFSILVSEYLQPLMNAFLELWGACTNALATFWEYISPFLAWFIEIFIAEIASKLEFLWTKFEFVFSLISSILQGFIEVLTNIINFIVAIFTGNWSAAWEAIKGIFSSIWEMIKNIVEAAINFVQNIIKTVLDTIFGIISVILNGIKTTFSAIWEAIKNVVTTILLAISDFLSGKLGDIKNFISETLTNIKNKWNEIWESIKNLLSNFITQIKDKISQTMTDMKNKISEILNTIKGKWNEIWQNIKNLLSNIIIQMKDKVSQTMTDMKNRVSEILSNIKNKWNEIWQSIKNLLINIITGILDKISQTMTNIKTKINTILTDIKDKWNEVWNNLKTTITDVFNNIWNFLKNIINKIISGIETMVNGIIKGINRMISALNNLSFDIPDWIPGDLGGRTFGLSIPKISEITIPKLALGGYVEANTPQLAMIGDNKHQGEVVAPEDKLQELLNNAVTLASNNNSNEPYFIVMIDLLKRIIELIEEFDMVVNIDIREIHKKLKEVEKRVGFEF